MAVAHKKLVQQSRAPVRKRLRVISEHYRGMPRTRVESYSGILLRTIRRELGEVVFFTREDLIHLSVFRHVSTIYRYSMVCTLAHYLVEQGEIIAQNRTDLSLKRHAGDFNTTPLRQRYYETIQKMIVGKFTPREKFTVMDVVDEWKTDTDLTVNNKRVAVRGAIPRLLKAKAISRADDFNYVRK